MNQKRRTEIVNCGGCQRPLEVEKYSRGIIPPEDIADERIVWTIVPPGAPIFALSCPCGWWTVNSVLKRHSE